jgi:hypothetical protein
MGGHDISVPSRPLGEAGRPLDLLRHAATHDHPATATASLDQAFRAERQQGASQRVPRDAEASAELALGRQAAPWQEPAGEDVGLDSPKHLDRRQVVPVNVPSASVSGVGRVLTLVHRSFTLANMKLAVPEGRDVRDPSIRRAVAASLTGARSDEIALYDVDLADPAGRIEDRG